jgi:hypothetical protein
LAPTITLPHLDEAQRRALRLADNKIALNAGWDVDLLKLELKELADLEIGFDLSVTGFSTGEIDVLLSSKGGPDDETIPAVPTQPRTRQGDIWICDQHRVGCGDGRDIDFLRKVIGDEAAIDAAFLDPALQRPDQRPRQREGAASRVRYDFWRDVGRSVPSLSFRSPRRLRSGLARWRRTLRVHGLAAYGRRLRGRQVGLWGPPQSVLLEQVERWDGLALPVEARTDLRLSRWRGAASQHGRTREARPGTAPMFGTTPR